jgi:hypothetical protein
MLINSGNCSSKVKMKKLFVNSFFLIIVGTVWHVKGRILGSAYMETEKDQEGSRSVLITGLQSFEIDN